MWKALTRFGVVHQVSPDSIDGSNVKEKKNCTPKSVLIIETRGKVRCFTEKWQRVSQLVHRINTLMPSSLKCIRIRIDTEECAAAPGVKFQPSGNRPEANRCQISHSARFHSPVLLPTPLYTLPSACLPFSQLLHGLDSFMIKFYCNNSWRGVRCFSPFMHYCLSWYFL